jgi:hypothetical protein
MCGAEDCAHCHPENFVDGEYWEDVEDRQEREEREAERAFAALAWAKPPAQPGP